MSEQPYSNREIKDMFDHIKRELLEIKTQTSKTNGRVGKLERWQTGITMSLGVIVFLVIPLVVYIFNNQVSEVEATIMQQK